MSLGTFDRVDSVAALRTRSFDVLVVGGGITGCGVALDAASRGLRTAMVERDDFASGTSSKSSKMIHGGLRYLDHGEIKLVYEALTERQRLQKNAPHLVRELPFMFPVLSRDGLFNHRLARAFGSTLWTYDLTGGARIGKVHKRLSKAATLRHMPSLPADNVCGGYVYYDCKADDARLTLALARTAAIEHGAVVVNRARVLDIETRRESVGRNGAGDRRSIRVEVDGDTFDVSARVIVNATGVWADDLRRLDDTAATPTLRPAKGSHVMVPLASVGNDITVILPVRRDKRSVFVVPWGDKAYIGTTDTDYDGPIDSPMCTADDIAYLLDGINAATSLQLTPADVTGTWAGLRPLVADDTLGGRTADLSRRHRVEVSPHGMITVAGGKLTTYRDMAADAVDAAVDQLGDVDLPFARRCRTKRLRLRGADGLDDARRAARMHPNLGPAMGQHLIDRYGSEATVILAMIDRDPSLGESIGPGLPYLAAEAVYAVRYEMATSLADVMERRTRSRLIDARAAAIAASRVVDLIADDLHWDEARGSEELRRFHQSLSDEAAAGGVRDPLAVAIAGGKP